MKDSLAPGIAHEKTVTTTPAMGVAHLGPGPGVLSTPSMLGLMEVTCLEASQPHLDANESTVGTMVHIWHRAAVPIGEDVKIACKLLERDRRKLLFEVKVTHGDDVIGDGTHERFVVDLSKFKKA
jgi:fluoroacetyl-CoA thioesterase